MANDVDIAFQDTLNHMQGIAWPVSNNLPGMFLYFRYSEAPTNE